MADSNETVDLIRYQWAKGDNQGTVETVSGTEGEWTLFQSGRRINTSLVEEFMLPIDGNELDFDSPTPTPVQTATKYKEAVKQNLKVSPIRALLDKQKKLDKHNIKISIPIDLLSLDMYSLLSTSFDEDEVNQELQQFIEDQIQSDTVIGMVQDSIQSLIKERYS
jgi:hypothetical protein